MGVRGLHYYINHFAPECYVEVPLQRLRDSPRFANEDKLNVLVDGKPFLVMVYSRIGQLCWLYHIDWSGLERSIRYFVENLESYGLKPIFFFKEDYDSAIADDPLRLSFIVDRSKFYNKVSREVYDLMHQAEVPNVATVQSKLPITLPALISSYAVMFLKELGCEIRFGVGGKPSLALYAQNPKHRVAAILSDNTDFFIFNLPCATFTLQNLDFTRETLKKFDRPALLRMLRIKAQALPVVAALMGDTGYETPDFLIKIAGKYSLAHPKSGTPEICKVARFANNLVKERHKMLEVAAELPANHFQSVLDYYNLVAELAEIPTDCEAGEDEYSQALRLARERKTHNLFFCDIYDLLNHGQYQVRDGLEDYAQTTLPVSCQLLQPVFQRLYGYLYRERTILSEGKNEVLIREYSTAYVEESNGVRLVQPIVVEGDYPPPSVLWKMPANGSNNEDWEQRWGLLLAMVVPGLWRQEAKRQQVLELLRELPGPFILTVLIVIWVQTSAKNPIFEEVATDALLLQAIWIYQKENLPEDLQERLHNSVDSQIVHLSNFFGSLANAMGLLMAVIGYPIPWQETMLWKFYNGPVFAYCCMQGRNQLKFDDLDSNSKQYVTQMKLIISTACEMPMSGALN